jgi:hypothetical protein
VMMEAMACAAVAMAMVLLRNLVEEISEMIVKQTGPTLHKDKKLSAGVPADPDQTSQAT